MKFIKASLLIASALAGVALVAPSQAAVTLKIVQGTSCAGTTTSMPITTTGGTVVASVCVDATDGERVCGATYPVASTNAAADAAAVQLASRTVTSPFTNVQDLTVFPATISSTGTALANAVPASGVQAGGTGSGIKIADLSFTVPSGLPAGTTFTYGLSAGGEIASVGTTAGPVADCNDLTAVVNSAVPVANFEFVTGGAVTTFTVTATAGANGTLVCSPTTVASGATSTCTATPASGFQTSSISGCGGTATGTGVNSYTTGTVTANCTVTAAFAAVAPTTYAITITAPTNGTLSCTPNPVNAGSATTCTATPSAGFVTQQISGCGGTATAQGVNTYTVTPTAACTVSAAFVAAPAPTTATAVPTLSEWAMMLMGMLLVGMAAVGMRKQQ